MGRLVKNPGAVDNTESASSTLLPSGSTAQRPDAPEPGQIRFNVTDSLTEFWDGSTWAQGASTGLVSVAKDTFTGNGALAIFSMSTAVVNETDVIVFIGGVYQNPGVNYTVDGSITITFTGPVPNLETVIVLHGYNSNT